MVSWGRRQLESRSGGLVGFAKEGGRWWGGLPWHEPLCVPRWEGKGMGGKKEGRRRVASGTFLLLVTFSHLKYGNVGPTDP